MPREHAGAGKAAGPPLNRSRPWALRALFCAALIGACAPADRDAAPAPDDVRAVGTALPPLHAIDPAGLRKAVLDSGGRVVVLNVWATWCIPCREEFPDLLRLRQAHASQGLSLVLVCADFDDRIVQAREFLAERGVDFPSYLKTGDDMEFIDSLNPEWTGALPATFVYDSAGRLATFWEGKASFAEMERRILPLLQESS